MKSKKNSLFIVLSCFLTGCNSNVVPNNGELIYVSLLNNEHIKFDTQQQTIKKGYLATFNITIEDGYSISSISYDDYILTHLGASDYKIDFRNIVAATRISISLSTESSIRYHANGGSLINSDADYYLLTYNFDLHQRLNTSFGNDYLKRDGYTLIGWNTMPDYSGEHIGLGSRATVIENDIIDLYAEWRKESDPNDFTYIKGGGTVAITGYTGHDSEVVIPASLGGGSVVQINAYAFDDVDTMTSLVLPKTMRCIQQRGFNDCDNLKEIYFYDNLLDVTDRSFSSCGMLSTLHINAEHNPCYANLTRHRHYADKIDMLILSQEKEKPRMIFMSGSSMWFSLEGEQVEEAFDYEYQIVNVALNSFFAAIPQFEVINHFVKEGDVFVHAPEVCSEQELMYTNTMNLRMWTSFELNYDLFSYVDIRKCENVFGTFAEFNTARADMEQFPYESSNETVWIDEYGCIPFSRPEVNGNEDLLDGARIGTDLLTYTAFTRLNYYYDSIALKTKNNVMFGYGPINYDGLPEDERNAATYRAFEDLCERMLTKNAYIINTLESSVFRGKMFYYTNYHLGTEASIIWTKTLTDGIAEGLKNEKD